MADSLFYAGENKHLSEKYADILTRIKAPKPAKNGDDVIADIIKRHGLRFEKEGE